MTTDLWLRQPKTYIQEALDEGFNKFTWHLAAALDQKIDVLSWLRNATIGHGNIRVMIVDYTGASEYSIYDRYDSPQAVYPTWAADEPFDQLIWLVENPVGDDPDFYDDKGVQSDMRPVKGQKHRVVLHRLGEPGIERNGLILRIRELQLLHPECELFISAPFEYNTLFGMGFQAVDAMPGNVSASGAIFETVYLPTGKQLKMNTAFDRRYKDWFELLGWDQSMLTDRRQFLRYNLRGLKWAAKNFDMAIPFVKTVVPSKGKREVFKPSEFRHVSDKDFMLPAARRNTMRNFGFALTELDKFMCDTCILHNACTLYREGSLCAVKGSEGMGLADKFGTRNAQAIIGGLDELLKKQVERVEDDLAEEAVSNERNPDLTRDINAVMSNGIKLAKLLDPALAGGPKVQVNVGVNGNAQVAVAQADPKQLVASIVAELEASGLKREEITSAHIKAMLEGMANRGEQRAIQGASVINGSLA